MIVQCNECGAKLPQGTLFCSECGYNLAVRQNRRTRELPITAPVGIDVLATVEESNTVHQDEHKKIILTFSETGRREILHLGQGISIGRADPRREGQPDLDLTGEGGVDLGVSRLHAIIRSSAQGVTVMDLNSVNGTRLNKIKLAPDRQYVIRNGDKLRFGRLTAKVSFE